MSPGHVYRRSIKPIIHAVSGELQAENKRPKRYNPRPVLWPGSGPQHNPKGIALNYLQVSGVSALLMLTSCLWSAAAHPAENDTTDALHERLAKIGLRVQTLQPAPIDGWYQVVTEQGLLYVSDDGQHMITGHLYSLGGDEEPVVENLTEQANGRLRLQAIAEREDELIRYPADEEKYEVTVFTDHTCGYCRTLHNNLDQFHQLGISVNYLAFPRGGADSRGAREIQSIWCADDPQQALTEAKAGQRPADAECDIVTNEHLQLGRQLGVNGTPAMILPDGRLLAGYRAAPFILAEIEAANESR